mmetsp:Transcript_99395/g.228267  ORF Transcript_99395/g.228267 Transcript_99395/m.228267 type:complete len:221 (-) Transcript_99395:980-1642(-)
MKASVRWLLTPSNLAFSSSWVRRDFSASSCAAAASAETGPSCSAAFMLGLIRSSWSFSCTSLSWYCPSACGGGSPEKSTTTSDVPLVGDWSTELWDSCSISARRASMVPLTRGRSMFSSTDCFRTSKRMSLQESALTRHPCSALAAPSASSRALRAVRLASATIPSIEDSFCRRPSRRPSASLCRTSAASSCWLARVASRSRDLRRARAASVSSATLAWP